MLHIRPTIKCSEKDQKIGLAARGPSIDDMISNSPKPGSLWLFFIKNLIGWTAINGPTNNIYLYRPPLHSSERAEFDSHPRTNRYYENFDENTQDWKTLKSVASSSWFRRDTNYLSFIPLDGPLRGSRSFQASPWGIALSRNSIDLHKARPTGSHRECWA